MATHEIEVKKFRALYKYSFDNESFYLFWKKGSSLVHDRYPLKEMSSNLVHWKGRPQSTVSNIKKSFVLLMVSLLVFLFTSSSWLIIIGVFTLLASLLLIFNEIGFLFSITATVLSYEDNSGSVYMFHGNSEAENWPRFEKELSNAINTTKKL